MTNFQSVLLSFRFMNVFFCTFKSVIHHIIELIHILDTFLDCWRGADESMASNMLWLHVQILHTSCGYWSLWSLIDFYQKPDSRLRTGVQEILSFSNFFVKNHKKNFVVFSPKQMSSFFFSSFDHKFMVVVSHCSCPQKVSFMCL